MRLAILYLTALPGLVRIASLVITLTSAGCVEPISIDLSMTEVRVDESSIPLPYVVALRNDGARPVKLEGVSVLVESYTLISCPGDADRVPESFIFRDEVSADHPTVVAPYANGVACGFLRWQLPPDPPPMLALVTCTFEVRVADYTLTSQPRTLVLQSRPGLLAELSDEAISDGDKLLAEIEPQKIVDILSSPTRERSPGFDTLIQQLERRRQAVAEGEIPAAPP